MKNPKSNSGDVLVANPLTLLLRNLLLGRKTPLYAFALLYCIKAFAIESYFLTRPAESVLPLQELVLTEPCMQPDNQTTDGIPGRVVKIQAWVCGRGAEESRIHLEEPFSNHGVMTSFRNPNTIYPTKITH